MLVLQYKHSGSITCSSSVEKLLEFFSVYSSVSISPRYLAHRRVAPAVSRVLEALVYPKEDGLCVTGKGGGSSLLHQDAVGVAYINLIRGFCVLSTVPSL